MNLILQVNVCILLQAEILLISDCCLPFEVIPNFNPYFYAHQVLICFVTLDLSIPFKILFSFHSSQHSTVVSGNSMRHFICMRCSVFQISAHTISGEWTHPFP